MPPTYGTTSVLGLRWLEGTNLVRDVDAGFQALAEDVEAALVAEGARGCFSAYRNSGSPLSIANLTAIVFDSQEFDVSDWYDPATGRYTPQVPGYYRLSARARLQADNATFKVLIAKNGIAAKRGSPGDTGSGVGVAVLASAVTALVQANGSSDYFQVIVEHNVGSATPLAVGSLDCYFQGELIGRT